MLGLCLMVLYNIILKVLTSRRICTSGKGRPVSYSSESSVAASSIRIIAARATKMTAFPLSKSGLR
jgi:hypothetical protein